MKDFLMRRLSFGAICPAGDCNFPPRAEATGHLDIDGDLPAICARVGLGHGDVAVDVGAFVGDTACVMAQAGAEVHAFEPFFDTYLALHYNTQVWRVKNGGVHPRIHCHNVPTGNGERVKLHFECPGPNYGMRSVRETTEPECLVAFKIDNLGLAKCKLMKIDCEGSEIPTLLGARETIKRCRPWLYVEAFREGQEWRGYTLAQLEAEIRALGYELEMIGEPPRWDWLCRPV